MVKKAVQRGRSERRGEAYFRPRTLASKRDARTKLEAFFSILEGCACLAVH